MKVTLISSTVAKNENFSNMDELVAYVARVSNPKNQMNNETAPKLINFLSKNKHWSPFEMADITLEIETTRDIAHQIIRHRSFSFQEFSQRYAEAPGFVFSEARLQDTKNRQNSIEIEGNDPLNIWWVKKQNEIAEISFKIYQDALKSGIAKEQARKILPEGLTTTRIYMKGSLRSWMHYVEVRSHPSTQKEHREIAEECAKVISTVFPMIEEYVYKEPIIEERETQTWWKKLKLPLLAKK